MRLQNQAHAAGKPGRQSPCPAPLRGRPRQEACASAEHSIRRSARPTNGWHNHGAGCATHLVGHGGQLIGQFNRIIRILGNRGATIILQIVIKTHSHGVGRIAAHGHAVTRRFNFKHVMTGTVVNQFKPEVARRLRRNALNFTLRAPKAGSIKLINNHPTIQIFLCIATRFRLVLENIYDCRSVVRRNVQK